MLWNIVLARDDDGKAMRETVFRLAVLIKDIARHVKLRGFFGDLQCKTTGRCGASPLDGGVMKTLRGG